MHRFRSPSLYRIDEDGDARLAALRASDAVPAPSAILSTSPGKYQVLWRVEGFDFAQQEMTLKLLAIAFGGDPACTDCNRVLRIPGFNNRKYYPAHLVAVEYPSDATYQSGGLPLAGCCASRPCCRYAGTRDIPSGTRTAIPSRIGRGSAHELAHGKDAVQADA